MNHKFNINPSPLSPLNSLAGPFDGGIKRYFRQRKYHRLYDGGSNQGQQRLQVTRFGRGSGYDDRLSDPPRKWRRFWKIKTVPRIIVRAIRSPSVKLFSCPRNTYLNTIINLAGNTGALNTNDVFGGKRITKARDATPAKVYSYNEVEKRIVLEIYGALKAYQS